MLKSTVDLITLCGTPNYQGGKLMDATKNVKGRLALLFMAVGLMLLLGAGTAFAVAKSGTAGHDVLRGTAQNDVLRGLGGNDRLVGLGDTDRLLGGTGNDHLFGGNDSDRMVGGAGRDLIDANEPGRLDGDRINCGPGRDRVINAVPTEDIIAANCETVRVG
jgi:Ca2+-binding RTX toxin-like protein